MQSVFSPYPSTPPPTLKGIKSSGEKTPWNGVEQHEECTGHHRILENSKGQQTSVFIGCRYRLCPNCYPERASKKRQDIARKVRRLKSTKLRFLTFTISAQSDVRTAYELLKRGMARITRTKVWKRTVRYGIWIIELQHTIDKDPHLHVHAVVTGAFIPANLLRRAWDRATEFQGSNVDIQLIRGKRSKIIHYLSKYISKSPSNPHWRRDSVLLYRAQLSGVWGRPPILKWDNGGPWVVIGTTMEYLGRGIRIIHPIEYWIPWKPPP